MKNTNLNKKFLTVRETALELGLSPSGVRNLNARRELPFSKFGGAIRIAVSDVERFIEKHRREEIEQLEAA